MEQPGSSGQSTSPWLYHAAMDNEEKDDDKTDTLLYSPQDFEQTMLMTGKSSYGNKRKNPSKIDALTIPISNDINYDSIEFPVACDICSNVYGNGTILLNHMKVDHADFTPFECRICSKPFSKMPQLQKHMFTHGSDRHFECPICYQRFSRQDSVKVHMRIHDKSKCVHCDVCEKSFLTQAALNIHQRIHRGEKPFKCHLCGKCFTQKNHVIMHIMRHSRVNTQEKTKKLSPRLFQCDNCPRSFIRLSDFEKHMQWTHGQIGTNIVAGPSMVPYLRVKQQDVRPTDIKAFYEKLNAKQKRKIEKVFCTTATQTDDNIGHIIIPRKYQNQGSATPRPEEDLYENEMFDEGMDRNYSSDEDDTMGVAPFVEMTNYGTSMSAVDEAFDAVLGRQVVNSTPEEKEPKSSDFISKELQSSDFISKELQSSDFISKELQSSDIISKELQSSDIISTELQSSDIISKEPQSSNFTSKESLSSDFISKEPKPSDFISKKKEIKGNEKSFVELNISSKICREKVITKEKQSSNENDACHEKDTRMVSPGPDVVQDKDVSLINIYNRNAEDIILRRNVPKIKSNFDMSNWRTTSVRGRSRGRSKHRIILGLRGASHLRLMRKSLINFISERNEEADEEEEVEEDDLGIETSLEGQFDNAEVGKEKLGKRMAKVKQHGADFMCSSKMCEICQPTLPKPKPKLEAKIVKKVKKELPLSQYTDKSKKLLQFILSGDCSNLKGTDFRLLSETENEQHEIVHDFIPPISVSDDELVSKSEEFHSPQEDDFSSVCIPTFSCKLCGREFRFEGKLHRHIESVHQRKVIFSPDVRPGIKRIKLEENESYYSEPIQKKTTIVNPELAALRSDWDDDDDEITDDVSWQEPVAARHANVSKHYMSKRQNFLSQRFSGNRRYQREYSSNHYPQGVKVNFNKFSGSHLTVGKIPTNFKPEPIKPIVAKSVSLETKCSKLLEKLFKLNLLLKCGHKVDHVSTVLGHVLQYYGVKMIEDYGQGQYEVLKYNLWRLIEWKVTMEQMEEFYTHGKSVEEMMDDIMNSRVPITAHTEPGEKRVSENDLHSTATTSVSNIQQEIPINDQLVISQVALDGNVTQLMLAQDVSPEMLHGAHIVTLDPTTGQVISQVTANQVILAGSVSDELSRHIESIDSQILSSHHSSSTATIVSSLPPGSIVTHDGTIHISSTTIDGELVEIDDSTQKSDVSK